jgi:DNA-binding SARP family transcriptional activator
MSAARSEYPHEAALVILHPNYEAQHMLLPMIMKGRKNILFLTIERSGSDLATVWESLQTAAVEQLGANLPALSSLEDAAKSTLKLIRGGLLYIEAFDYAEQESVVPWIATMVERIPAGTQIVLGGRTLPSALLANGEHEGKVALYPIDPPRMLLDYNQPLPEGRILLEVYGCGSGRALVNGKLIDHWDGVLPRSLFFYFIDRGMTTRDEIFNTFWPSLTVREATNVFHVTKRKISEILGFDLTVYWSGFYRISPNVELHYDVVKFLENVQNSAIAEDEDAIPMLETSIDLYRGMFLSTLPANWMAPRREELRTTYVDALSSLARIRETRGELEQALGLYMRAAAVQPHREDLARGIMTLYRDLGHPQKALDTYERLKQELRRKYNVSPDPRTSELLDDIRAAV